MTVIQLSKGLKDTLFSSEEVTRAYIDNIHERENKIQAFITINEDEAIERAKEIDQRRIKGEPLSSLAGIPMGLKDNICTKDILTTCGSKFLSNYIPTYNATVADKLHKKDAILLGKLNMDEFSIGSTTENSMYKTTVNPVNLGYVSGGSSGGSAAAVASLEVAFSIGTDTGGSIRQPASFCGVVGLKPTYGAVSRYGLVAYASSLDQIGPITKDVQDAAFIMNYIAGHDDKDATSHLRDYPDYLRNLNRDKKGIKIGICKELLSGDIDSEVTSSLMEALRVFEKLGVELIEVSLPSLKYTIAAYEVISSAEVSSNLARFDGVRYGQRATNYNTIEELYSKSRGEGFGQSVKTKILLGTYLLSAGNYETYYERALEAKKRMVQEFTQVFTQCNAILGTVAPTTAYKLGEKKRKPEKVQMADYYTAPANLAGLPALSLPFGQNSGGLPIGIQLIGPRFGEADLLQLAYAFEQEVKVGGKNYEY